MLHTWLLDDTAPCRYGISSNRPIYFESSEEEEEGSETGSLGGVDKRFAPSSVRPELEFFILLLWMCPLQVNMLILLLY
jgi:hypothetical protein